MEQDKKIRVRFAPSPTGHLHIGGLRTALSNWLFARRHGGMFLVRIEDTDLERSTPEYRDSIVQSLAWTGLTPDEDIVTQSDRFPEHIRVAQQLLAQGKAYRCFCSQEEMIARCTQGVENVYAVYDGYCRDRVFTQEEIGQPHAIRFKIPEEKKEVVWDDLIRGRVSIATDQLDDFIIIRSNDLPIYNFVVVVDDAHMSITHVIRGEDHVANTPKQILLYEACGYSLPQFAHLPMILGPSGEKLSKRDGAVAVIDYRHEGYLPHALLNYLARLGWSHGDQEIFSIAELIEYFSLDTIGKKAAIFDFEKLAWVNSVYLRQMSGDELLNHIVQDIEPNFLSVISWDIERVKRAIELYKDRVKTVKMLVAEVHALHSGLFDLNLTDMQTWITVQTAEYLAMFIELLEGQDTFTHDKLAESVKRFVVGLGIKMVVLLQPIRLALIGKASGPGVFEMLEIVGKEQSIARIRAFYKSL